MRTLTIESATSEPILATIVSQNEPTGVPSFQITASGVTSPVAEDWVAGSFTGTWDSADGTGITATSPLIGSAGFTVVEGTTYVLWIKWTASSSTPVRRVATLVVR